MDSPSRMESRDFSMTSASTALSTMFLTMSIAESSGTPLLSSVARVREKREMAIIRTSPPKTGALSTSRSHLALPLGVFFHARKP